MILIIGHEASLTGAPRVLLALAQWFKETKGESIEFILKTGGPLLELYQKIAPVHIWNQEYTPKSLLRSGWDRVLNNPGSRRKQYLHSLVKKKIKVIFCNTIVNGDILEALQFLDVPVVSRIPELEMVIKLYNRKGLADKTFRYSDRFIAVSDAVRQNLGKNHSIENKKIHVIPNGLLKETRAENSKLTKASIGIPENAFVVGACGTLIWRKGIDLFIRLACELVKKKNQTGIYLIWIGGDKNGHAYCEYIEEIKKLGLENHVIITGETPTPGLYYPLMDVFCMTSREEPFGMVILEAAEYGLPVLSFEKSGYPEEFTTPDIGFVLPYADFGQMAEKVIHLKDHPELLATQSDNIKKKAAGFTFEKMAGQIYDVIRGKIQ